ncbi:DUF2125 domain-containing protein [Varunaivibrio sulfuroxidans]|uniref:DUF2125 domain-containing protein n=1 Tax=Varunaivibrio sulfuroxidans TaxID=1773489 RepID=A0A4R3J9R5_9PROT|nr:DUF2125 domain-containing protein [Varunaivibrio sulfuroxidans]TCS61703.1 hypothetical protein EDD55_107112 [Varunaivibrio sulfuroxidans]WES32113.1 DUF2125 domain-containing protein [Varunaivibrio sulfuroxidans]
MAYRNTRHDGNDAPHLRALNYRPPRTLRIIRVGLGTIIAGAVIVLAWTGFWFVMAFQLRGDFETWVAHQRAKAVVVGFRRFEIGGYPFHIRLNVMDPTVSDTGVTVPWAWSGDGIVVQARPWRPGRLSIFASGRQRVTVGTGPDRVTYSGGARVAEVHVTLGANVSTGWPLRVRVRISELRLLSPTPGRGVTVGDVFFAYDNFDIPKNRPKAVGARADISIHDMRVPPFHALPLGNEFQHLSARFSVKGRLLGTDGNAAALTHWRDGGGAIDLKAIHVENGPLNVQGAGTLALDGDLQPVGSFTAKIEGLFALLDQLRARGMLRDRDVVTAKLVLGALFQRPANGAPPALSMAITVRNRKLFIGPVPIAAFPRIAWPGSAQPPGAPSPEAGPGAPSGR